MSTQTVSTRSTTFKVGWIALLAISALAAVSHIILAFVMRDEATLFIAWAGFDLYAVVVFYIPFRRGERWAWYTSWILVIGFASLIIFDPTFGVWYLGAAGVMALALLLTRSIFFQEKGEANR